LCIFIHLEIEPRQLEPVEFVVSGSATGGNNRLEQYSNGGINRLEQYSNGGINRLEQYSNGGINNFTTSKRTVTSTENTGYNQTINTGSNQSYAPYFIVSLHDRTVTEGESIFFEVVVSGKNFNKSFFSFFFFFSIF
jgi:hypothetical protein